MTGTHDAYKEVQELYRTNRSDDFGLGFYERGSVEAQKAYGLDEVPIGRSSLRMEKSLAGGTPEKARKTLPCMRKWLYTAGCLQP